MSNKDHENSKLFTEQWTALEKHRTFLESLPRHQYLFMLVSSGKPEDRCHSIAEINKITINELKDACRRAGEENIKERGYLLDYEINAFKWACENEV